MLFTSALITSIKEIKFDVCFVIVSTEGDGKLVQIITRRRQIFLFKDSFLINVGSSYYDNYC